VGRLHTAAREDRRLGVDGVDGTVVPEDDVPEHQVDPGALFLSESGSPKSRVDLVRPHHPNIVRPSVPRRGGWSTHVGPRDVGELRERPE